jgi:hypothetical protein
MDFIDRSIRRNKRLTFLYKFIFPLFWLITFLVASPLINGNKIADAFPLVMYRFVLALFFAMPYYCIAIGKCKRSMNYISDERTRELFQVIGTIWSAIIYFFIFLNSFADKIVICFILAFIHITLITIPSTNGFPDPYWDE